MAFGVCIDGGGIGGIGPARFLATARLPRPKFMAGTSVGSILCASMGVGRPVGSMPDRFMAMAPKIFCDPGLAWRMDPRKPRFSAKGLESALRAELGVSTRVCDSEIPLFIVCHDWVFNRPKVYDNTDCELLWEVVAASCSAPTWFPPRNGLADGGTIANNPSMCAITGAKSKLGIPVDQQIILSLGTNGDFWKNPDVGTNTSKVGWASILLDNPCRGNEMLATFQAQTLLDSRYLRLEPILSSDYGLADLGFMREYGNLWDAFYDMRVNELQEFLKRNKVTP